MIFSGSRLNIDIPRLTSAGKTGSYSPDAAGSIGDAFGTLADQRVDAASIFGTGAELRAKEQATAWDAEQYVKSKGLLSVASVTGTKIEADERIKQIEAARKAKENASRNAGIFGFVKTGVKLALGAATGGASLPFTAGL